MINKKIGIIGCGNMGEALLSRLINVADRSVSLMAGELDAKRRQHIAAKYKIIVEIENIRIAKYCDIIILAVKPKDYKGVLNEIRCAELEDKLLISMAAGVATKTVERIVGKDIPVIRVMPNMAAVIGESMTSISAGSSADSEDLAAAKEIFSTIGDVIEVDEKLIDSITAISGSGPAYFFYLIEALVDAAVDLGISEDVAKKIVLKTALGSSRLLEALEEDPITLRGRVTSKGGTTEAAFKVLEKNKFKNIVKSACRSAYKRSKEISRSS